MLLVQLSSKLDVGKYLVVENCRQEKKLRKMGDIERVKVCIEVLDTKKDTIFPWNCAVRRNINCCGNIPISRMMSSEIYVIVENICIILISKEKRKNKQNNKKYLRNPIQK